MTSLRRVGVFADFKLPYRRAAKGGRVIAPDLWMRHFREMRVTDVVLGLNNESDRQWKLKYAREDYAAMVGALADEGVKTHAMPWWRPNVRYVAAMRPDLDYLAELRGIASVMLEAERHVVKASHRARAKVLPSIDAMIESLPVPVGLTSYGFPPATLRELIELIDRHAGGYHCLQAYSIWRPKTMEWTTKPGAAPGVLQQSAVRRWREVTQSRIIMGLPAYSQARPGMPTREAMEEAIAGTLNAGVDRVLYWSLKNILRSSIAYEVISALGAAAEATRLREAAERGQG